MGPRAGRALDRPAHRGGGLRAGRRGAARETTSGCSTSSGDVLFQVYFLALLLEERGQGRPRRGGRPLPREADPPPPARLRRARGRDRRGRGAQLAGRSSASRSRAATIFGRPPRDAAVHALCEEGAEAGEFRRARVERSGDDPGDRLLAAVREAVEAGVDPELSPAGGGRQVPRSGGGGRLSDIETVHARQILDSRGNPTVEVDVLLHSGASGRAAVPSGASTGEFEAVELRDGGAVVGRQGRVPGRGQRERRAGRRACAASTPPTRPALDRAMIDLDGTPNKGRLGANAILGVSLAAAQGGRGRGRAAAVALPGRRGGARAARCR